MLVPQSPMGSLPKNAYTEIGFRYKLKKETMHPLNEHAKCSLRYVGIYSGLSSLMKISLHCACSSATKF